MASNRERREFDAFVEDPRSLPQGKEVELVVRDLTPGRRKYECRWVRALISEDPNALPEGDVLWLRTTRGMRYPKPWAIRILGELGEFRPWPPPIRV